MTASVPALDRCRREAGNLLIASQLRGSGRRCTEARRGVICLVSDDARWSEILGLLKASVSLEAPTAAGSARELVLTGSNPPLSCDTDGGNPPSGCGPEGDAPSIGSNERGRDDDMATIWRLVVTEIRYKW